MASSVFTLPFVPALGTNGTTQSGAKLYFYDAGTLTPHPVYTDAALSVEQSNPVQADGAGRFSTIYLDPAISYRIILKDAVGVQLGDVDNYTADPLSANLGGDGGSSLVGFLPSGTGAVARTVASRLGDTISVKDFGAVGDGTTDDTAGFTATGWAGKLGYAPEANYTFAGAVVPGDRAFIASPAMTWASLTDGGKLDIRRGFRTSDVNGANIWRFADRVFVGDAAATFAGDTSPDGGTSWLSQSTQGPSYLLRSAQLLSMTSKRAYGIVGAASTSRSSYAENAIGMGSVIINDAVSPNNANAWGYISEVQHQAAANNTYGMEFAFKNASGVDGQTTPYTTAASMTIAILLTGGGDDSFGPVATNPNTAGIVFTTNNSQGWHTGIQFRNGSIPGTEPEAIALASNYALKWYEPGGTVAGSVKGAVSLPNNRFDFRIQNGGFNFVNNAGNSVFFISAAATDANRVNITSSAAGSAPLISASGSDANIDLKLSGRGSGVVQFGTLTATADAPVTGYLTIKDNTGTVRKLAVIS